MAKKENPIGSLFRWFIENILWDYWQPIFSALASSGLHLLPQLISQKELLPMLMWYYSVPLYFIFVYGLLQIISDISNTFSTKRVMSLIKSRNDGVQLRNKGAIIYDILDAKYWMEEYDKWDNNSIKLISRISKTDAEMFKIINRFVLTKGNLATHIPTHNRKYNVLEEKLARLEELIKRLKRLKSNDRGEH